MFAPKHASHLKSRALGLSVVRAPLARHAGARGVFTCHTDKSAQLSSDVCKIVHGATIALLPVYDQKTQDRQLSPLFQESGSENRQAQKSGNVRHAPGGGKARARRAVLQASALISCYRLVRW